MVSLLVPQVRLSNYCPGAEPLPFSEWFSKARLREKGDLQLFIKIAKQTVLTENLRI